MNTDQMDHWSPFHTEALRWRIKETTKHKQTFMEVEYEIADSRQGTVLQLGVKRRP
jgi:hypothetical protein